MWVCSGIGVAGVGITARLALVSSDVPVRPTQCVPSIKLGVSQVDNFLGSSQIGTSMGRFHSECHYRKSSLADPTPKLIIS